MCGYTRRNSSWLPKPKYSQRVTRNSQHEPINQFESIMQNKPNSRNVQNERKLTYNKGLQKKRCFRSPKNKPNSNPISNAGKRTKEAQKKKRVSGTFLRLSVAGKIDFLDGCDILLGKIYGKSQFNLFWRLIL